MYNVEGFFFINRNFKDKSIMDGLKQSFNNIYLNKEIKLNK